MLSQVIQAKRAGYDVLLTNPNAFRDFQKPNKENPERRVAAPHFVNLWREFVKEWESYHENGSIHILAHSAGMEWLGGFLLEAIEKEIPILAIKKIAFSDGFGSKSMNNILAIVNDKDVNGSDNVKHLRDLF